MNRPELDKQRITDIRRRATGDFRREMRFRAVKLWLLYLALTVLCAFVYARWQLQTDPQQWLLYAIVCLLFLQSLMSVGLWLWLLPRVLLLLKEMKLLRIDIDRDSLEAGSGASDSLVDVLQPSGFPGRKVMLAVVCVVAVVSVQAALRFPPPPPPPAGEIQNFITLGDSESAESVSEIKVPWSGMFPTSEITTYCDAERLAVQEGPEGLIYPGKITDDKGRELPVETHLVNDGKSYQFTVHLPEQILPGQIFTLRERLTLARFAKKEGDAWKVRMRANWGAPEARYTFVYKMPKDASIVDGRPNQECRDDTARYALYKAVRRDGTPFEFSFAYKVK